MPSRVAISKRTLMWLTVGLTVAYVLFFAVTLPEDSPSKMDALLFWEANFAGPMIIACALSIVIARLEARITFLGFAAGYSILTALTFYWTFGFEHDAQYQLMLFLIPLLGFPIVAVLGLAVVVGLVAEKVR
jgi:hypothetical protein